MLFFSSSMFLLSEFLSILLIVCSICHSFINLTTSFSRFPLVLLGIHKPAHWLAWWQRWVAFPLALSLCFVSPVFSPVIVFIKDLECGYWLGREISVHIRWTFSSLVSVWSFCCLHFDYVKFVCIVTFFGLFLFFETRFPV